MFKPNIKLGVTYSFLSLVLLGLMPVISNSRPVDLNALNFALYLSLWQLLFSLPLVFMEFFLGTRGVFAAEFPKTLKNRTISIIMGTGVIFGISTYLYVLSVEKAGTVSAAIAIQAYPLFAILWETVFLRRRKSATEMIFTAMLIVSLFYLSTEGTWRIDGISVWFLAALGVPFLWSVAHVIIKEVLGSTPITPGQVTFFRVLVSSIVLFIAVLVFNESQTILWDFTNAQFQWFSMVMGLVYYLELVVWFYAVRHVDVSVASSITTPWPVVTMVLAAFLLHEEIAQYQMIAMAFVALSIYGVLYAGKMKRAALK